MEQVISNVQANKALNALVNFYTSNTFTEQQAIEDMQNILVAKMHYEQHENFTQSQVDFIADRCLACFDKLLPDM
ncbi:hypothetical protein [Vibrio phage vB_VibM_83AMN]|nr:hypothetical protein [Vibrio phage vB_VibM_83AMN]